MHNKREKWKKGCVGSYDLEYILCGHENMRKFVWHLKTRPNSSLFVHILHFGPPPSPRLLSMHTNGNPRFRPKISITHATIWRMVRIHISVFSSNIWPVFFFFAISSLGAWISLLFIRTIYFPYSQKLRWRPKWLPIGFSSSVSLNYHVQGFDDSTNLFGTVLLKTIIFSLQSCASININTGYHTSAS